MFKKWFNEVERSPITAHVLLIKNKVPYTIWGVYLLGPFGERKHLYNKASSLINIKKELTQWAAKNNYDSVEFQIEES